VDKIYRTGIKLLMHKTAYLKVKLKKKMVNTVTSHHTTHITGFSGNTTTFSNFYDMPIICG